VPERWCSGKVGLVLAYLVIYNKQVQMVIERWKMKEPIERVLQVSKHSPLSNMKIKEKGLLLRVANRMKVFTSVVAGMVDEVKKRMKECMQVSKNTEEK
jgi:deoxycytidine triphosphate deaminase